MQPFSRLAVRALAVGAALSAAGLATAPAAAQTRTLTFEGLQHGARVDPAYGAFSNPDVVIRASNENGPDQAAVFDTRRSGTADPDLEGPRTATETNVARLWTVGNIPRNTVLGNVLILPENDIDVRNNTTGAPGPDGLLDSPDDAAEFAGQTTSVGQFRFRFSGAMTAFGFDLVDVDVEITEIARRFSYVIFQQRVAPGEGDSSFREITRFPLVDLTNPASRWFEPGVVFGDHSANRVSPITAQELGVASFDRVYINFGGSGAIDNAVYTPIPEPATAGLLAVAGAGMLLRRRRA